MPPRDVLEIRSEVATVTDRNFDERRRRKHAVADIGEGRAKNVYLKAGDIITVPERLF